MYLLADGDDVGNRIELLLLERRLDSAREFSECVNRAVASASKHLLASVRGSELIFVGGDAFLAALPPAGTYEDVCREIQSTFLKDSGCSLSIGLGPDPRSAANALRRAKLLGKNRVVILDSDDGEHKNYA